MVKTRHVIGFLFFTLILGLTAYAADAGGMQSSDSGSPAMSSEQNTGVININTASVDQLKMLPGIDDQIAKNIVYYRDTNGPFITLDDLLNVKGVTKEEFNQVNQYLVLQGDTTFRPGMMK
jgi:competence protein ComEA